MVSRVLQGRFLALLLVLCGTHAALSAPGQSGTGAFVAITDVRVVDGTGKTPTRATVLIRGSRIAALGLDLPIPEGAREIVGSGHTLIPGLFDLHTHLSSAGARGMTGNWEKNLKAYLYCGVTSVVDFSFHPEAYEPIRRLVQDGTVAGPRISFAARMTTPGGHGAEAGRGELSALQVLTPDDARAAMQRILPYGPDAIKVFTDGWRYDTAPDMTSMTEDTLAAIVESAHQNNMEVLTHTVTLEKAKIAARTGVDAIVHGIRNARVDEEMILAIAARGTIYAPTLSVYERRRLDPGSRLLTTVLEPKVRQSIEQSPPMLNEDRVHPQAEARPAPDSGLPAPFARRWQNLLHNTAALRNAGVTFAAGTDAGVLGTYHGWATLRELQLLVLGGLTPLEAITAATGNSAKALGLDSERGTIAPGKLADLVLIEGRPDQRIQEIENIRHVFINGHQLDRAGLAREIASPALTALAGVPAPALIDDFERKDSRSSLDTLWIHRTDPGHDHSRMIWGRILRSPGDHALAIMARMSHKERPFARVEVPLSRGGISPVETLGFRGLRFDVRGDGGYRILIATRGVRNTDHYQAGFRATGSWQAVEVDFASLHRNEPAPWTGSDCLSLIFEIARPPGAFGWLELDNITFQ